jgi:hypothetical protein
MKSRRGVSEIIATMVVLMIVSALGVILYNISASQLNSQQSDLITKVESQKNAALEKIEIITVDRIGSDKIYVYYIDYGTVKPVISSVYLICVGQTPGASTQVLNWNNPEDVTYQDLVNGKATDVHYLKLSLDSLQQQAIDSSYVSYKLVSQRGNIIESQG